MNNKEQKAKLYSYFYGSSVTFQLFLIGISPCFAFLGGALYNYYWSGFTKFLQVVSIFFSFAVFFAGIAWMLVKKCVYNKKWEDLYDEVLQASVEKAKETGLDKVNISRSQIENVDPVVLTGVAYSDEGSEENVRRTRLGKMAHIFFVPLVRIFFVVLLAVVFLLLSSWLTYSLEWNPIVVILIIGVLMGALAAFLYLNYEVQSYVNPKTIAKLDKRPPHLITKIGTDDAVRVTLPAITVYMFGEEQLYIYYQYFNIITGKIFCEGVHEYFYEDIVGITSAQETKIMYKRHGFLNLFIKSMDYLRESIAVVTRGGCTHRECYFVDMGDSLLDTQFTGMRNLIRQKKEEK